MSFESSGQQANALIDLVLAGEDPEQIMGGTIEQIKEGYGSGPFAIGSKVKVNQAYTAEKVGGGSVALAKDDVVSIVHPHLGEQGYDKMVLLDDGVTRVVVPLEVLGEDVEEQSQGPSGHEVPSAKGSPEGMKPSSVQGDPAPKSKPEQKGSSTPTAIQSTTVGKPAPKSKPEQKGSSTPTTIQSKKVESVAQAKELVIKKFNEMSAQDLHPNAQKRINELSKKFEQIDDKDTILAMYNMLFSEEEYPFERLEATVENRLVPQLRNPLIGLRNTTSIKTESKKKQELTETKVDKVAVKNSLSTIFTRLDEEKQ